MHRIGKAICVYRAFLLLCLGAFLFLNACLSDPIHQMQAGLYAPDDPVQVTLKEPIVARLNNFTLTAHHAFQVDALVLGSKRYRFDEESQISPVDLSLGWGPMSNPDPLRRINIKQSNRFYFWRYGGHPPMAKRDMQSKSANMHMIPANEEIKKQLERAKRGDIVAIKGYLVDVVRDDGWRWKSSRNRYDTGNGACELVYVTSLSFIN